MRSGQLYITFMGASAYPGSIGKSSKSQNGEQTSQRETSLSLLHDCIHTDCASSGNEACSKKELLHEAFPANLACINHHQHQWKFTCRPFKPTSLEEEETGRLSSMGSTGRRSSFRNYKHNGILLLSHTVRLGTFKYNYTFYAFRRKYCLKSNLKELHITQSWEKTPSSSEKHIPMKSAALFSFELTSWQSQLTVR